MSNNKLSFRRLYSLSPLRNFLSIFLPIVFLLGCLLVIYSYFDLSHEKRIRQANELNKVKLPKEMVTADFKTILSDLMVLSAHSDLQTALKEEPGSREALGREFLVFSEKKGLYDQIRFLDQAGLEIVRVNYNKGRPTIVPKEELQLKASRYYFEETFSLRQHEVYVSTFDLNIERNQIELPLKPLIRLGTPIFDNDGEKIGIILINYMGEKLLHYLEKSTKGIDSHIMLLNAKGFWLKGLTPEDEWGFMYKDGDKRTFAKMYPDAWQRMSQSESGQFQNAEGMFTFTRVSPLAKDIPLKSASGQAYRPNWKIVSFLPAETLRAESLKLLGPPLILFSLLLLFIAYISWRQARLIQTRLLAEGALRESESKYRSIYNNVQVGIWRTRVSDGKMLECNECLAHMFAYKNREDCIKNFVTSEHYVDPGTRERWLDEIKDKGVINNFEVRLSRQDGSIIWARFSGRLYAENGYLEGVATDITEHKLIEKSLKKLSHAVEQSPVSIVICDREGTIEYVNPMFSEITGYSSKEAVGQNPRILKSEEHPEAFYKELWSTITSGKVWHGRFHNRKKDGEFFWEQASISPIINKDGEITNFVAVKEDVTEKMRTEEETMRAGQLASIGELAAGVAHEINNPINSMINLAQLLVEETEGESGACDILNRIIDEGTRISVIVRGLLSFAREGEGEKVPVDIGSVISDCLVLTQIQMKKDSILCKINIPRDLSPVDANYQQLQQVFLNIINNAHYALNKRYPGADKDKTLEISVKESYMSTCITFYDRGIGIPSEIMDNLVKPFFSTKPASHGTGLGLSISHGIINDHGGRLSFDSIEGELTRVTIDLPIAGGGKL